MRICPQCDSVVSAKDPRTKFCSVSCGRKFREENLSAQEKRARSRKFSAINKNNWDKRSKSSREKHRNSTSSALVEYWEQASDADRQRRGNRTKRSKKTKASMSKSALARCQRDPQAASARAAHARKAKEDASPEDKLKWVRAAVEGQAKARGFVQAAGERVHVDSSWEAPAFRLLVKLFGRDKLLFAGSDSDDTSMLLRGKSKVWVPDFIIPELNLIIDVKGNYHAMQRFATVIEPRLPRGYSVALMDFNCKGLRYDVIEHLLQDLCWAKALSNMKPFAIRQYQ